MDLPVAEVKLGGAFHVAVEVFGMEWSGNPTDELSIAASDFWFFHDLHGQK